MNKWHSTPATAGGQQGSFTIRPTKYNQECLSYIPQARTSLKNWVSFSWLYFSFSTHCFILGPSKSLILQEAIMKDKATRLGGFVFGTACAVLGYCSPAFLTVAWITPCVIMVSVMFS